MRLDSLISGSHFAQAKARVLARRSAGPMAPALVDLLEAQNARHAPSASRAAHLLALRRGAAAVVTGQQVGLLLGPLYTLYKAATTVRLARDLAVALDEPVVPVFWLQTEDHDLAEIARCHVATPRGAPLTVELEAPPEKVSVAHRCLPVGIASGLARVGDELGGLPHAKTHLARLARHYRPGARWSAAFSGVLAELFADEGLVLIDPRDPALAPLAAPVHRRALLAARSIADALAERVRALEEAGRTATVHVRAGSPLSFFHPDGAEGPRYRLEPVSGGYAEVGGSRVHGEGFLLDALETRPECFSTSALLRPVLQDTWLPTIAYVGGPGEIAYFEQLVPVYEAYEMPLPLVVPRARLRLVEEETRSLMTRRHLTPADACLSFDDAIARARERVSGEASGEALTRRLLSRFDDALLEIGPALRGAGPGTDKAIDRTRGTVARALEKLARRYEAARSIRDEALVRDVRRLQAALHPEGLPQERFFGMSYFAARYGERPFLDLVLEAATPFEGEPRDVEL